MKKSQRAAAVAIIAIGLVIAAISAGVLISELGNERAARARLEKQAAQLKLEIEQLKSRPILDSY